RSAKFAKFADFAGVRTNRMGYLDKLKTLEHDAPRPETANRNLEVVTRAAQPAANTAVDERAKLDAPKRFPGRTDGKQISCDVDAGEIVAVEIASEALGADIWLAFRDDFNAGDGKAIFYAHELPTLKYKTRERLREIHKVKLAFGPGSKVRQ